VLLSPDMMRLLLALCTYVMALLAAFYLRERRLGLTTYLVWGLLIVCIPLLGPFLVILIRPGNPRS
jgi:hypothetical protein